MLQIIEIKKLVVGLLEYVRLDFEKYKDDETKTFLYKVLGEIKDGRFDFFEQSKSLFSRDINSPRGLRVLLEFPKDKSPLPCYVIREPGKREGPANSIGKITGSFYENGAMQYRDSRQYAFDIMCLTDNMLESITMSEVLYAMLLGVYDSLADRYNTISFDMKELMAQNDLIPTPIFVRSIGLDLSSEEYVPGLVDMELLGKVSFEDAGLEATLLSDGQILEGLPGSTSEIKTDN